MEMQHTNTCRRLPLSLSIVAILFIYYLVLCVTGAYFAMYYAHDNSVSDEWVDLLTRALLSSVSMAILGNSIYYIRKLYKACMQNQIDTTGGTPLAKVGATVYYFSRPLFSMGFAILIVIGIMSGDLLISGRHDVTSNSFVHVCMFLSFFAGFSAGNFIKYLEFKSDHVIEQLRGKK